MKYYVVVEQGVLNSPELLMREFIVDNAIEFPCGENVMLQTSIFDTLEHAYLTCPDWDKCSPEETGRGDNGYAAFRNRDMRSLLTVVYTTVR